jgi:hypothetical protein
MNTTPKAAALTSALLNVTLAAQVTMQAGSHLKDAVKAAVAALKAAGTKEPKAIREAVIKAAMESMPAKEHEGHEGVTLRANVSKYLSQDCGVNVRGTRSDKGKGKGKTPAAPEADEKQPLTMKAIAAMIRSYAKKEGEALEDVYANLGDALGV